MQKTFDQMKALMAADVLYAYPDHNKPFHISTDTSDYQLGACITQKGTPVAYYSKKLNSAQMIMLQLQLIKISSVSLRHSRNSVQCYLVLNSTFTQTTKNILNIGDSSQQCLYWIFFVDEYGPELH